jgi:hypothetical protein
MRESLASILWRRLDVEGHDGCRLLRTADGFELAGQALFEQDGEPCCLAYRVQCAATWQTLSANVRGFLGARDIDYEIARSSNGTWTLNGVMQPQAEGLIDVDLNFTPATNLIAIRRFGLAVGAKTPAAAAWLTFPEPKLVRLDQTYGRLDQTRYAYTGYDYAATLEVSDAGFVLEYPELWTTVAVTPDRPA